VIEVSEKLEVAAGRLVEAVVVGNIGTGAGSKGSRHLRTVR
jgi:hypothetical protein